MVTTVPIISHHHIVARCQELAAFISQVYPFEWPLFVVVREGGVPFFKELMRHLPPNMESIEVTCKSYSGTDRTDEIQFSMSSDDKEKLYGAEVLIIDDIIDSGGTFRFLERQFNQLGAKDVQAIPLIFRKTKSEYRRPLNFGFVVPSNKFLVGFGMDYNGEFRDLPRICTMEKD